MKWNIIENVQVHSTEVSNFILYFHFIYTCGLLVRMHSIYIQITIIERQGNDTPNDSKREELPIRPSSIQIGSVIFWQILK